jgi:hypothetical protein
MGKKGQDGRGQEGQGRDQKSEPVASASIENITTEDWADDPAGKGSGVDDSNDFPQRPGSEERADLAWYGGYFSPIKEAIGQGKNEEHPRGSNANQPEEHE